jgi:hypothetical protein
MCAFIKPVFVLQNVSLVYKAGPLASSRPDHAEYTPGPEGDDVQGRRAGGQ